MAEELNHLDGAHGTLRLNSCGALTLISLLAELIHNQKHFTIAHYSSELATALISVTAFLASKAPIFKEKSEAVFAFLSALPGYDP